jgi:hypothetical protein
MYQNGDPIDNNIMEWRYEPTTRQWIIKMGYRDMALLGTDHNMMIRAKVIDYPAYAMGYINF